MVLEWVAISFSGGVFWPRNWTPVSHITGRFFTIWATGKSQMFSNKLKKDRSKSFKLYGAILSKITNCTCKTHITVYKILQFLHFPKLIKRNTWTNKYKISNCIVTMKFFKRLKRTLRKCHLIKVFHDAPPNWNLTFPIRISCNNLSLL